MQFNQFLKFNVKGNHVNMNNCECDLPISTHFIKFIVNFLKYILSNQIPYYYYSTTLSFTHLIAS